MYNKRSCRYVGVGGHRNLNFTECFVIARYRNFNTPKICKITVGADEAQVDDVRRAYQADPDSSGNDFETDQSASESDDQAPPALQSTKVTSRGG